MTCTGPRRLTMDRASTQQLLELFDREESVKATLIDAEIRVEDIQRRLQQEMDDLENTKRLVARDLATIESSRQELLQSALQAHQAQHHRCEIQDLSSSCPAPQRTNTVLPSRIWDYLPNASSVVLTPNGWIEIECPICHGNTTMPKAGPISLLKGIAGVKQHLERSHNDKTHRTNEELVQLCKLRDVPDAEVHELMQSTTKKSQIAKRRSTLGVEKPLPHQIASIDPNGTPVPTLASILAVTPTSMKIREDKKREPLVNQRSPLLPTPMTNTHGYGKNPNLAEHERGTSAPELRGYKIGNHVRKASTIVLTKSGKWVELRCYICNGNGFRSTKNLALGVAGFKRHIKRDHDITLSNEDVILGCAMREVEEAEVMSIEDFDEKLNDDDPIEYVAFVSKAAEGSTESTENFQEHDVECKQILDDTPSRTITEDSHPDLSLKLNNSITRGVKREHASMVSDTSETDTLGTTPSRVGSEKPSASKVPSPTLRTSLAPHDLTFNRRVDATSNEGRKKAKFYDICPCTMSGHDCRRPGCSMTKVCLANIHNESCRECLHVKPSCIDHCVLGNCEQEDKCNKAHDRPEQRKKLYLDHDCNSH
ncbi:hypothetical protein BDV97DRAFT_77000 [Delphinella strobiligena]|nr:hypothetical protein BDV97DRAFT_77000 [Delphinella strobiligena]